MTRILVEEGYQLSLPLELQPLAPIGSRFQVTVDEAGRIILTPEAHIRAILMETFGMWADRDDIPDNGIEYMNEIRRGQRLDEFEA
jgi:hypothetical protein